jgi:hypothetical protein
MSWRTVPELISPRKPLSPRGYREVSNCRWWVLTRSVWWELAPKLDPPGTLTQRSPGIRRELAGLDRGPFGVIIPE